MEVILLLLLVLVVPPGLLALLAMRFEKLSAVQHLHGRARAVRLCWLVALATGIMLTVYLLVRLFSAKIGSAHGAGSSAWPWGQQHPVTVVLLVGLGVTLVLGRKPSQRLAALSFGAGVLLAGSGLGVHWYFTDHQQELTGSLRYSDIAYRQSGWQQATLDSFARRAPGCVFYKKLDETAPVFPGYPNRKDNMRVTLARLRHQAPPQDTTLTVQDAIYLVLHARVSPHLRRLPLGASVEIQCIVDTTGQVTLAHVTDGLGPGYDEEAVRVARSLSPLSPGTSGGVRVPAVWRVSVPFSR